MVGMIDMVWLLLANLGFLNAAIPLAQDMTEAIGGVVSLVVSLGGSPDMKF